MEKDSRWKMIISPAVAPMTVTTAEGSGDNNWRSSGNTSSTVNAVSFGFLATAILVSMFLVMAVVERIFRPRSATATATPAPGEAGFRVNLSGKLQYPSPRMVPASDVPVLMPGETIPTFIAHPVPPPCPHTRVMIRNLT